MKKNYISIFVIFFLVWILLNFTQALAYSCGKCRKTGPIAWGKSPYGHWSSCSYCGWSSGTSFQKHFWSGSATCTSARRCTVCGYSSGYGSHRYTSCSKAHCSGSVCSVCGRHSGSCGGGHTYKTCSHCGRTYCSKCTSHTPRVSCPCNNNRSCSNPHCRGIRWCSYCGSHRHVPCNTRAECPEPHCTKAVCSVCGGNHQGICGGGHKYHWVTDSNGETQTHTNKCYVTSTCTATNGQHSASWQTANGQHTSVCRYCPLTYTHQAIWSTEQRSATEPHPCVWHGGCTTTHTATWEEYYKVNGGVDGDSDGGPHTRECSTCGITEIYHSYTTENWNWQDTSKHIRTCKTCGLSQTLAHNFTKWDPKEIDESNHSELYKHWKICTTCDPEHKEVDEEHEDNGAGICTKCGQILWKMITYPEGQNITNEIVNGERIKALREQKIKIVEVVGGKTQYIQELRGADNITANNDILTIIKNGEYEFTTGRGGTVKFEVENISREILVDKILEPITSTTGEVTIIVRTSKAEEKFDKTVYIKEGSSAVTDSELENGGENPFSISKTVSQNGTYIFTARDTAGNTKTITVVVDNIIKGQTTVAISNDVFINGHIFTEILVNPNEEWRIDEEISNIVKATAYKAESTTRANVGSNNIKFIKVMDMQRKELKGSSYLPGSYYIQVAIGGSIFNTAGTYIIDLEEVNLPGESSTLNLSGKNRIIVEVQELKDLT